MSKKRESDIFNLKSKKRNSHQIFLLSLFFFWEVRGGNLISLTLITVVCIFFHFGIVNVKVANFKCHQLSFSSYLAPIAVEIETFFHFCLCFFLLYSFFLTLFFSLAFGDVSKTIKPSSLTLHSKNLINTSKMFGLIMRSQTEKILSA